MRTSLLLPAVAALICLLASGCSRDRHVLNSTEHLPATLTLVDTVNDTTVWSYDVPAGQKLVYEFNHPGSMPKFIKKPEAPANSMDWWTYPEKTQGNYGSYVGGVIESGTVELPGTPIMPKVSYRDTTADKAGAAATAEEIAAKPPVRLELEVFADGSVTFDDKKREIDELEPLLQAIYGPRRIVITGKPGTPRENLVALANTITNKDQITVMVPAEPAEPAEPMTEEAPGSEQVEKLEESMEQSK